MRCFGAARHPAPTPRHPLLCCRHGQARRAGAGQQRYRSPHIRVRGRSPEEGHAGEPVGGWRLRLDATHPHHRNSIKARTGRPRGAARIPGGRTAAEAGGGGTFLGRWCSRSLQLPIYYETWAGRIWGRQALVKARLLETQCWRCISKKCSSGSSIGPHTFLLRSSLEVLPVNKAQSEEQKLPAGKGSGNQRQDRLRSGIFEFIDVQLFQLELGGEQTAGCSTPNTLSALSIQSAGIISPVDAKVSSLRRLSVHRETRASSAVCFTSSRPSACRLRRTIVSRHFLARQIPVSWPRAGSKGTHHETGWESTSDSIVAMGPGPHSLN